MKHTLKQSCPRLMLYRVRELLRDLSSDLPGVNLEAISRQISQIERLISTNDAYFQLSTVCSGKNMTHSDWGLLAGRIAMHQLKRVIPETFSQYVEQCEELWEPGFPKFVKSVADQLDAMIIPRRDWTYNIFAVSVLKKSYLTKFHGVTRESPQYLWMRVACFLWYRTAYFDYETHPSPHASLLPAAMERIRKVYNSLSTGEYTHASPTLFNAGFVRHQLSSCFQLQVDDDINSITENWRRCAQVSKASGGIGMDVSAIRHSEIGTQGFSKGIVPWLKIFDQILKSVDQEGRRKGSGTIYLQPWHIDVEAFLELKKNVGHDDLRARDLFYALWIPDEFMRRVRDGQDWLLICPHKAPELLNLYGEEFDAAYHRRLQEYYDMQAEKVKNQQKLDELSQKIKSITVKVKDCQAKIDAKVSMMVGDRTVSGNDDGSDDELRQDLAFYVQQIENWSAEVDHLKKELVDLPYYKLVKARDLFDQIITSQIERGMPFMLYKDAVCAKSNQKNVGPVRCSNLCCEILQVTEGNRVPSCNLASVSLNSCFVPGKDNGNEVEPSRFDFDKLERITRDLVRNINQVIEVNWYIDAVPEIKATNFDLRPLGIGVQGLADVIANLDLAWEDPEVTRLNFDIFETMYYAAVSESVAIAKEVGRYPYFDGSPASQGLLQFDLWGVKPTSNRYDWNALKQEVMTHGMRNSLLIALMPTASSASILGNNECIEPFTSNMFSRSVLSGQFTMTNEHLVRDLTKIGMWTTLVVQKIIANGGSIQSLTIDDAGTDMWRDEKKMAELTARLAHLKRKYKTVYEIPQRCLLQLSIDRARYVCQTQSFNCWMDNPTPQKLYNYHMYGWKNGIKTGMYYLRQLAVTNPLNVSLGALKVETTSAPETSASASASAAVEATASTDSGNNMNAVSVDESAVPSQNAPKKLVVCTDDVCHMCSA